MKEKGRDKVIRNYLLERDWDEYVNGGDNAEFQLKRRIIKYQNDDLVYEGILKKKQNQHQKIN